MKKYGDLVEENEKSIIKLEAEVKELRRIIQDLKIRENIDSNSRVQFDEDRFRTLVNEVPEYLYSLEFSKGKISNNFHSPHCEEITGYSPEDYAKNQYLWMQMIHPEDLDRVLDFIHGLNQPLYCKSIEHRIVHKDGSVRWVLNMTTVHLGVTGETIRQSGFLLDITWRKYEEDINRSISMENRRYSIVDELTSLYNRRGFMELAEQQLRVASRMNHAVLVFFIDVDGLKHVNDSLGHHKGDDMLVSLAQVLKSAFQESDLIARIGGDEFTVMTMENEKNSHELFLERLCSIVELRNHMLKEEHALSISVGASRYNFRGGDTITGLIDRADKDMYENKRIKFSVGKSLLKSSVI